MISCSVVVTKSLAVYNYSLMYFCIPDIPSTFTSSSRSFFNCCKSYFLLLSS
nr:MAG TPA: hypothetical protein [Podoviridae sp. ctY3D12]